VASIGHVTIGLAAARNATYWMYTRSPSKGIYRLRAVCFRDGTVVEVIRFWWQD